MVYDETGRIMRDLFGNVWGDKTEIVVDNVMDITLPVSLRSQFHGASTN